MWFNRIKFNFVLIIIKLNIEWRSPYPKVLTISFVGISTLPKVRNSLSVAEQAELLNRKDNIINCKISTSLKHICCFCSKGIKIAQILFKSKRKGLKGKHRQVDLELMELEEIDSSISSIANQRSNKTSSNRFFLSLNAKYRATVLLPEKITSKSATGGLS